MGKLGKIVFGIGVFLAIIMGVIVSYDPGYVCQLLGFMIAATGILIHANANRSTILKFGLGIIGTYLFASFANGPMPHVPILFGIGGTLILTFYLLILWQNAAKFKDNAYKLAGYTFLITGFWFTCGLASRQYQPILGSGESPIDIMFYFVLAMLFFWLSEVRTNKAQ